MHIGDTEKEAEFRAQARAWLSAHASPKSASGGELSEHDLGRHIQHCRDWQRVLFDNGWAGITWPTAFGGRGASPVQAAIFAEEMAQFDVSTGAFAVSIGMGRLSSPTALPNNNSIISNPSCAATRCGASCSANPDRAVISRHSEREPYATATTGS